jgi:hypothetical protein
VTSICIEPYAFAIVIYLPWWQHLPYLLALEILTHQIKGADNG